MTRRSSRRRRTEPLRSSRKSAADLYGYAKGDPKQSRPRNEHTRLSWPCGLMLLPKSTTPARPSRSTTPQRQRCEYRAMHKGTGRCAAGATPPGRPPAGCAPSRKPREAPSEARSDLEAIAVNVDQVAQVHEPQIEPNEAREPPTSSPPPRPPHRPQRGSNPLHLVRPQHR